MWLNATPLAFYEKPIYRKKSKGEKTQMKMNSLPKLHYLSIPKYEAMKNFIM